MIYRLLYFPLLISALILSPAWAQEEDMLNDPALEAIEALKAKTADPADVPASDMPVDMTAPETETEAEVEVETEMGEPVPEDTVPDAVTPSGETLHSVNEVVPAGPLKKDVILVLDNSGSMKKNDPGFLASKAVHEFLSSLDEDSRVAVIIFDQNVRVAVPLTQISEETRPVVLKSVEQLDYKGLYTDSPAAIERAIYDLKNNGREDAKKLIVFMTDGIVDTGNVNRDVEKAKWLQQDLAAGAADAEIQIFSIAFTDEADFQLIQALAQRTGGEYYRALQPEDLQNVFTQIHTIINKVPEPEIVTPVPVEPPPPVQVAPPPPPVIIEVPVPAQRMDEEEELRSMMILVALSVLIIAVIIMVLMLIRGSRKKSVEEEYAQEAFLNDINNYTSQSSYKLGSKPTMLGRVAGTDTDHLNYIVIPQSTIGRRHALIEYKDFAYWIIDQGSINGTFVNDQLITSETRLKHGDRIRLHKLEFEFVMPEMVEAGMTMVSKTVMAAAGHPTGEEATIARHNRDADMEDLPEPVFDLTGGMDTPVDPDEEDTIIKGTPAGDKHESHDATIMLDSDDDEMDEDNDATIRPDRDHDDDDDSDLTVDNFRDLDKK